MTLLTHTARIVFVIALLVGCQSSSHLDAGSIDAQPGCHPLPDATAFDFGGAPCVAQPYPVNTVCDLDGRDGWCIADRCRPMAYAGSCPVCPAGTQRIAPAGAAYCAPVGSP